MTHFLLYLAVVDNTTIKLVSTMTFIGKNLVKDLNILKIDCLNGGKMMAHKEMSDLKFPL